MVRIDGHFVHGERVWAVHKWPSDSILILLGIPFVECRNIDVALNLSR